MSAQCGGRERKITRRGRRATLQRCGGLVCIVCIARLVHPALRDASAGEQPTSPSTAQMLWCVGTGEGNVSQCVAKIVRARQLMRCSQQAQAIPTPSRFDVPLPSSSITMREAGVALWMMCAISFISMKNVLCADSSADGVSIGKRANDQESKQRVRDGRRHKAD